MQSFLPLPQSDPHDPANTSHGRFRNWAYSDVHQFVPAWEGLRGVAVIMVLVSHVHRFSYETTTLCGKGGVAVFFVLSGFLITGVLTKQQKAWQMRQKIASGNVTYGHLWRFYMDRSVRLYPALVTMVAVTGALQIYMLGKVPRDFYYHVRDTLLYLSDFKNPRVTTKSVWDNTWSLAVEEQFYIFWSLLLPVLLRLRPSLRALCVSALALSSLWLFFCREAQIPGYSPVLTEWFSPFSNVWAMFLGAGARLSPLPPFLHWSGSAWIGLAGLLYLALMANAPPLFNYANWGLNYHYVGFNTLVVPMTTICTLLIIVGSVRSGNKFLEFGPLRFFGRVSYSLYLYQIPLLLISGWPRGWMGTNVTATAFVMASVSTLYVEEPIRSRYHAWQAQRQRQ